MRLSARILDGVGNVNIFDVVSGLRMHEGDTATLYLQLIDSGKDLASEGFSPAGRRYTPSSGATLTVTLYSTAWSKSTLKVATQPFPGDLSIWAVSLTPADLIRGTVSLKLTLTQSAVVTSGIVQSAILVDSFCAVQ